MPEPFEFEKFGKYILVKKIAVGGMAEIFLAKTEKKEGVSRFVVIKRILPQFSSNKKFRTMFKQEGKITSHLRHTNMVYHHEFGVEKGIYYIVMEHISGCSLKELVNKSKQYGHKFPTPVAVNVVRSIASALNCMHNSIDPETGQLLSLIHRDVTPHNIMIGFNGDIKLIDFGITKVSGVDLTNSGVVKGKFSYMSPEQISGAKIDNKSDIFSLGIVFWELLAGQKLFSGTNIQSVFGKIRDCRLPKISHIRSGISPDLVVILKKMLEKDSGFRYQQAGIIEKELHLFLNKKYPNFSQVDFQNFIKKIYENEIIKERKFLMNVSKEISQINLDRLFQNKAGGESSSIPIAEGNNLSSHPTAREQAQSQISNTAKVTEKKTAPSLKGEPTVVGAGAPISYRKTQVSKNDGTEKKQLDDVQTYNAELVEDTSTNAPSSSWDSLKDTYENVQLKSKFVFHSFLAVMLILVVGVWYLLFNQNPIVSAGAFLKEKNRTVETYPVALPSEEGREKSIKNLLPFDGPSERQTQEEEPDRRLAMNKAEAFFNVYIETSPSGADVYLNGDKVGQQTPVLINVPKAGFHRLEVRRDGYEAYVLNNLSSASNVEVKLKKIKKKKRRKKLRRNIL